MPKLLTEEIAVEILTEGDGVKTPKSYWLKGVFLHGGVKNTNGRIYPVDILRKECQRYIEENIKQSRGFGELGHPDQPKINLDRVSHLTKELHEESEGIWVGKAKITSGTPMGKIATSLLDEGAQLGASSRALGSLDVRNEGKYVQDDLSIICAADIVAEPSAKDAMLEAIMEEKEWIMVNGIWKIVDMEKAKKDIENTARADRDEKVVSIFKKFLEG